MTILNITVGKSNYTNTAYEAIKNAIINNELMPGSHLNVPRLAKTLGMSRTPVREALKILEKDGLVESKDIGAYVKHMSLKELNDLSDVRALLECQVIKSSLPNIDDEELADIENRLLLLRKELAAEHIVDYHLVSDIDSEFHSMLRRKSNNAILIGICESISHLISRYSRLFLSNNTSQNLAKAIEELLEIIGALKKKELNAASMLMEHHIKVGMEELANLLKMQSNVLP